MSKTSWRNLRGILEILVLSNWHFSHLLFYTKSGQILDVLFVVGLVFSRSSLIFYYRKTQECELKIGIVHVCNLVLNRDLCTKVYCMIIDYVLQRLKPIYKNKIIALSYSYIVPVHLYTYFNYL